MVLSPGTWTVAMSENHRKKQLVALRDQVCVVSADCEVSVAVALNTLVSSNVGCQWRLSS